jgi:hypothetical protein
VIVTTHSPIALVEETTQELLAWADQVQQSDTSLFCKARTLATRLGAHYRADGLTEIGFWTPELGADMVQPKNIYLEVLTPKSSINPLLPLQTARFRRDYVQLEKQGEYFWGVVSGMRPGTRNQMGSFYWLKYLDMNTNEIRTIGDVLANSFPYGVYAPAELYDMQRIQAERSDL